MISDTIAAAVVMTIILFKPFQHNDNIILLGTTDNRRVGLVFGVWCLVLGVVILWGTKI